MMNDLMREGRIPSQTLPQLRVTDPLEEEEYVQLADHVPSVIFLVMLVFGIVLTMLIVEAWMLWGQQVVRIMR